MCRNYRHGDAAVKSPVVQNEVRRRGRLAFGGGGSGRILAGESGLWSDDGGLAMSASPTWIRALVAAGVRPALLTVAGLAGVGTLLLVVQVLLAAPVVPGPGGLFLLVTDLTPSALALGLPVAVLVGATAVGRSWAEGGEWLALAASGVAIRRVVPALLAIGLLAGGVEWGLTHGFGPAGRAAAREVLQSARLWLRLRPGQPAVVGGVLLHAAGVDEEGYTELFAAAGRREGPSVVAAAPHAGVAADGRLELRAGNARVLAEVDSGWKVAYDRALLRLDAGTRRLELMERSDDSLRGLIRRTRAAGRSGAYEELVLFKRSTLPLAVPLLALLGLPAGARRARPASLAAAVVFGWWAVMRVCDQGADVLGPALAAAIPPVLLAAATLAAWATWRDR